MVGQAKQLRLPAPHQQSANSVCKKLTGLVDPEGAQQLQTICPPATCKLSYKASSAELTGLVELHAALPRRARRLAPLVLGRPLALERIQVILWRQRLGVKHLHDG